MVDAWADWCLAHVSALVWWGHVAITGVLGRWVVRWAHWVYWHVRVSHVGKAVNELTHRSLGLVSHGSESDMIFFPRLRVKIKKSMIDL